MADPLSDEDDFAGDDNLAGDNDFAADDDTSSPSSSFSFGAAGPLIPDLPDDLAVQCLARVSHSHHSSLALVARSWRALLRSPLYFAVRSSLRATQPLLLLNLRTPSHPSSWFLLDPHLSETPNRRNPSSFRNPSPGRSPRRKPTLLPPPPLPTVGAAAAALGPAVYLLGGSLHGIPSAAVQILDACLRRWRLGPRMSAAREFAAAAALTGKIYAVGGCLPVSEAWAEALDPSNGWAKVPSPPELREKWMHGSALLAGRLFAVADRGGVVYDPAAEAMGRAAWGLVPKALDLGWRGRAVVVDGILYSYDFLGKIRGYDPEVDQWKPVEGVEELPRFMCGATLANLGGLLCLVWEGKSTERRSKEVAIEWAGIKVSRTISGGLQGSILWLESIDLAVPKGSSITHCVTIEL